MQRDIHDPYHEPSAYDILGIKQGVHAKAEEIGKAFNKAKNKAKRLRDSEKRAERMRELEWAKEQLQRPENRVLVDFFMLSGDVFSELCVEFGERMAEAPLPTADVLGRLAAPTPYDDLIPRPLEQLTGKLEFPEEIGWFDEDARGADRLPIDGDIGTRIAKGAS